MLYAILKLLAFLAMRLLFRLERNGLEHVPRHGALLLVANHSSVLDPPIVGGSVQRRLAFLAKAELFQVPLFGGLLRRLNANPVRRAGSDAAALRTALRILEAGQAVLVFPEGTRGPEGILRPPKAGAGMLAVLSGATVVPAFIRGSGSAWPRGARLPRPAKVLVTFGPPFRFEPRNDIDRKTAYESASRAMMDAIARVRDTAIGHLESAPAMAGSEALGGVGAHALGPPKSTHGRNGQHA